MTVHDFLVEFGVLIVACLALVQPWIVWFWRRYLKPERVEIYETGTLEVGYSAFGTTLALHGTLRALNAGSFVRTINLSITRTKDSARHAFEWGAFRAQKVKLGLGEETLIELPAGFFLECNQPRPCNIVFFDFDTKAEAEVVLRELQKAWFQVVAEASTARIDASSAEIVASQQAQQRGVDALYTEFARTPEHVKAYAELTKLCYWDEGRYELEISVHTSRPDKTFTKRWGFVLTAEDAERLRLNVFPMLREACGLPAGIRGFAYPKYEQSQFSAE